MSTIQLLLKTSQNSKDFYENHTAAYTGDAGIDLYFVNDVVVPANESRMIDLEISCEMRQINTTFKSADQSFYKSLSYFVYPRSSISKTPLRMANSVGIIDSGYRDTIKVVVDNISNSEYTIKRGQKLFQICSPMLEEIVVRLSDTLTPTNRGKGFGSSDLKEKAVA